MSACQCGPGSALFYLARRVCRRGPGIVCGWGASVERVGLSMLQVGTLVGVNRTVVVAVELHLMDLLSWQPLAGWLVRGAA
jgi:hypothetical protein